MAKRKTPKNISAEEFDRKFDAGEDISAYLDFDSAVKRITVDFPVWMLRELDAEATRFGISRQAVIKTWIGNCLDDRRLQFKSPTKKQVAG